MVSVFDQLAIYAGNLIGADQATGGFILGFGTIVSLILVLVITRLVEDMGAEGVLVISIVSMAFVVLVGWWPAWTALFIFAIALSLILFHRGA